MIYMRSKKLLPFHAQQSTYLSTMQLHIRLHCTIATMQSSTMQLHNYKFLVFRLISFCMTWMELEYFLPGLSKMQQCPEKTIQLERFCYPNQKTKQGIFDRESFIRPCDKQQTTNFPNFVFSKVRYVQKFFFSIVISSCDQDYQISVWLKPLKDCGCAKLN